MLCPTNLRTKAESYEYEGTKVHLFKTINTPSYFLHGIFNDINARFFLNKIRALGIDINDIAVAHGHTSQFACYALALKAINPNIKTIVQHHDCDPYTIRNGRLARLSWNTNFRALQSITLIENVDLNLCISEYVRESLLTFPEPSAHLYYDSYREALAVVKNVRKPHITDTYVLYNGVDTNKFYPEKKNRDKQFTIGCIGNFVELKDQITLLRAINLLIKDGIKDIKVIFVGSGPTLTECQKYISENNLDSFVEIRSEVHHAQLRGFYNTLDLFVLPTFFEGFGCVCTEAAACGVPYMICKHQGAAEYIAESEKNKWTFEPHDHVTLAMLIKDFKNNPRPQTLVHPFDINVLVKKYIDYIDKD